MGDRHAQSVSDGALWLVFLSRVRLDGERKSAIRGVRPTSTRPLPATGLPARRTSGSAALHTGAGFAGAVRIHGPHLGIRLGVGLLHAVDVVFEGDLLAIASQLVSPAS